MNANSECAVFFTLLLRTLFNTPDEPFSKQMKWLNTCKQYSIVHTHEQSTVPTVRKGIELKPSRKILSSHHEVDIRATKLIYDHNLFITHIKLVTSKRERLIWMKQRKTFGVNETQIHSVWKRNERGKIFISFYFFLSLRVIWVHLSIDSSILLEKRRLTSTLDKQQQRNSIVWDAPITNSLKKFGIVCLVDENFAILKTYGWTSARRLNGYSFQAHIFSFPSTCIHSFSRFTHVDVESNSMELCASWNHSFYIFLLDFQ